MVPYASIYLGLGSFLSVRLHAVGNAEAFGVEPGHFPEFLGGAPDGAEGLGALAEVFSCQAMRTATYSSSRRRGLRLPGNGFDDELNGLQPAACLDVVEIAHAHEPLAVT